MHYRIQLHWPWFIVCNGKYFDILFAFMICYPKYQPTTSSFLTDIADPWHFAQFIVKGPWAKIARRYRTLLPLAGVGNTLTRRRKGLGHIFSVDTFANSDFGLITLFCIAVHEKEEQELFLPSLFQFVILIRQVWFHYQDSYDLLPVSLIYNTFDWTFAYSVTLRES